MIFRSKTGVPPIAAAQLQHWAMLLSAYSYTIVYMYKPGVNHNNVDGLSCLPLSQVHLKCRTQILQYVSLTYSLLLPNNLLQLQDQILNYQECCTLP